MKKIVFFSSLLINHFCFAQDQLDSVRIRYAKSIQKEELKTHLTHFSSDEFEGRETGKKGQKLAADYIASQFKKLGISTPSTGAYFQKFPLVEQERKGIDVRVDGLPIKWINDFYSISGLLEKVNIEEDVVFGGYGIKNEKRQDYKEKEVRGKVLLLFSGEPPREEITDTEKIKTAKEAGVKGILLIKPTYSEKKKRIKHITGRNIVKIASEKAYNKIPVLYVNDSVGEVLLGKSTAKVLKSIQKSRRSPLRLLKHKIAIQVDRKTEIISSENVLGYIEGAENKEELIVLTAHYDHLGIKEGEVYNGADDDGSGTVALLEMAEAFMKAKKDGVQLNRSILFMMVSGEEKGLLGSQYYTEHPIYPMEKTMVNLNIDMIGRHDAKHTAEEAYVYVIGADKLSLDLHQLNKKSNELYVGLELDYTFNDENDPNRYYYRSDHYNFAKKKVPVIFYFSGVHEDYHKPTDTVDKINFERLEERTRLVFYTAWELATRKDKLVLN